MKIGKEESNVQNAQLSMQELYGKTQEPPHKKVLLTENMQYSDRERIHAYWLSRVDGIGAVTAAKLYESCGSFEGIYMFLSRKSCEKGAGGSGSALQTARGRIR